MAYLNIPSYHSATELTPYIWTPFEPGLDGLVQIYELYLLVIAWLVLNDVGARHAVPLLGGGDPSLEGEGEGTDADFRVGGSK